MVMAVDACEEKSKPNQPGSGAKKETGTNIKNKLKGAIGKVKQQVEKNPDWIYNAKSVAI